MYAKTLRCDGFLPVASKAKSVASAIETVTVSVSTDIVFYIGGGIFADRRQFHSGIYANGFHEHLNIHVRQLRRCDDLEYAAYCESHRKIWKNHRKKWVRWKCDTR